MGLQDAAFKPSRASFYTSLLNNCGSGYGLGTATCHTTVVGSKQ